MVEIFLEDEKVKGLGEKVIDPEFFAALMVLFESMAGERYDNLSRRARYQLKNNPRDLFLLVTDVGREVTIGLSRRSDDTTFLHE